MQINSISIRKIIRKTGFSSLVILLVMITITAILQNNFFTLPAIINNLNAYLPLILVTMGQAIVIISGGIDLSVGSALSLMNCVLAKIMITDDPFSGVIAIVVVMGTAVVTGLINGLGMGYLRLPPIIVTFSTYYIFLGVGLLVMPRPTGNCTQWVRGFYSFSNIDGAPGWLVQLGKTISPSLVLLIIAVGIWLIIKRTRFSRHAYAVGSNENSAYASGINTARTQLTACIINSFYIMLAALFFTAQNLSGDARMGDSFTLKSIASAVIGGIALTGGRGDLVYALVGALILGFVNKIIFFADLPNAYQTLVGGLIVILAIALSQLFSFLSSRSARG